MTFLPKSWRRSIRVVEISRNKVRGKDRYEYNCMPEMMKRIYLNLNKSYSKLKWHLRLTSFYEQYIFQLKITSNSSTDRNWPLFCFHFWNQRINSAHLPKCKKMSIWILKGGNINFYFEFSWNSCFVCIYLDKFCPSRRVHHKYPEMFWLPKMAQRQGLLLANPSFLDWHEYRWITLQTCGDKLIKKTRALLQDAADRLREKSCWK